ncbi:5728_t:CDS:2, partial [Funneliformis geosporum]
MNSFYDTARDNKSSFFLRELAGGVTSAGQRNIKLVADFVESKGFQKKYGDTDSLYIVCSEECFQECDEEYDSGIGFSKEEYWKNNGLSYLEMAYEEVLFSVVFTGKKKYYGIPHESKLNFNKKPFIRGVEIVKR